MVLGNTLPAKKMAEWEDMMTNVQLFWYLVIGNSTGLRKLENSFKNAFRQCCFAHSDVIFECLKIYTWQNIEINITFRALKEKTTIQYLCWSRVKPQVDNRLTFRLRYLKSWEGWYLHSKRLLVYLECPTGQLCFKFVYLNLKIDNMIHD